MDENIQTVEFLFHLIEQPVDIVEVAHVGFDEQGAPSKFFHFAGSLFGGCTVAEKIDDHIRAVLGEVQGNGFADSTP